MTTYSKDGKYFNTGGGGTGETAMSDPATTQRGELAQLLYTLDPGVRIDDSITALTWPQLVFNCPAITENYLREASAILSAGWSKPSPETPQADTAHHVADRNLVGDGSGVGSASLPPAEPSPASSDLEAATRERIGARRDMIMRNDYPILAAFHKKHALGSLMAPSCLVCGQVKDFAIKHAELPDIGVCEDCRNAVSRRPIPDTPAVDHLRGLDTDTRIRFYEHDFYVLSNFSAFEVILDTDTDLCITTFKTAEHAYHFFKFRWDVISIAADIQRASSAHEAFKIAERNKSLRREDWDVVKVGIMRDIIRAKAAQHEYVRRKLLQTGDRELVEDSWRDDFWGWGPNRDGQNMLGKLWMEVRTEIRAAASEENTPADKDLAQRLKDSAESVKGMSPEDYQAMCDAQRKSWVRGEIGLGDSEVKNDTPAMGEIEAAEQRGFQRGMERAAEITKGFSGFMPDSICSFILAAAASEVKP